MLEEYGERWLESGEMEMTFLRPVYAGDTLEIHFDDAPGTVVVNCTNQRGELVATGATRVRKE
jgi:acyl dehydratase